MLISDAIEIVKLNGKMSIKKTKCENKGGFNMICIKINRSPQGGHKTIFTVYCY